MDVKKSLLLELCRLCLVERGCCDIFDRRRLCDDIYKCTGVKVSISENLPHKICTNCLQIIIKASELRTVARRNDRYLRNLFNCPEEEDSEMELTPASSTSGSDSDEESTEESVNTSDIVFSMKPAREHPDNTYKCPVCPKIFTVWRKLYMHHRLHNKCYKCPIQLCNKGFATKGDLQKHIRVHTGEKPYECDQCNKSFSQQGSLKAHKRTVHSLVRF